MLRDLKTFPLLDGYRGRPRADVDALVALVVDLADAVVGTDAGGSSSTTSACDTPAP
jgi:hypothetical protein